ncbi:MAG: hypothetical protein WBI14_09430 [Anaerolineaceae bacterium]
MAEELRICPNCGGKNLPQASRCVQCGLELEEFFRIDDQVDTPSQSLPSLGDEEGLPELLRDLQRPDLGGVFGETKGSEEITTPQNTPEQVKPQMPDWLSRVRERAKVEDPSGDLIKKVSAADEIKDDANRVSQEFDAWIARLQESAQREAMLKAKAVQPSETGEEGVPDWLQRVRELTPKSEEQVTEEVALSNSNAPQESVKWDSGWSEEDLERLRRGEYKDPDNIAKPVADEPLEQEMPEEDSAVETELEGVTESGVASDEVSEILKEPVIEHQISDLEEDGEGSEEPVLPAAEDKPNLNDAEGLAASEALTEVELPEKKTTEDVHPDLLLLKSQNERAELLRTLINQEGKPSIAPKISRPQRPNWSHVALPLLLLIGIIGALLFGGSVWPILQTPQAASVAFLDAIKQVKPEDPVLVVFDYQAATSAEVEVGAGEALRSLIAQKAKLTLQTTQASGLWLVDSLRQQPGLAELPTVRFVPGGSLGMLIQTFYAPASPVVTPAIAPDGTELTSLFSYSRILVISDSSASIRDWMEQISPWLPAGTLLFVTPHQEAINLSVYYDSGQIGGYLAGMSDYSGLGADAGFIEAPQTSFRAYQVGLTIMIMLLLLGMVSKADHDTARQVDSEVIE